MKVETTLPRQASKSGHFNIIKIDKCREEAFSLPTLQAINSPLYIGADAALLPYLTIKENLTLGATKANRKQLPLVINTLFAYFKLPTVLLEAYPQQISLQQSILIQLIRAIAHQRECIIIDATVFPIEPLFFESLYYPLEKIATANNLAIYLITKNRNA